MTNGLYVWSRFIIERSHCTAIFKMKYTSNHTDAQLIQGCLRKDRLAQQFLYRRYYGKLLGIGMRYTGDRSEADDVLNRAFLKIFNNLQQYQHTGSFQGWMSTIVFNTALDYVRGKAKYREVMDFNPNGFQEGKAGIHPDVIEQLFAEDLYRAIQELPIHARTVFSLYVIDGYNHREVAELLGIKESTSKYHLAEARKKLQQRLVHHQPNRLRI